MVFTGKKYSLFLAVFTGKKSSKFSSENPLLAGFNQ